MCGRYTFATSPEIAAEFYELTELPPAQARYNIAPTQSVGTVLFSPENNARRWRMMRWGLIPSWSKDKSVGAKMINARSETLATKPAFKSALQLRRCLIPANGFYEWRKEGRVKRPYYISMRDGGPLAFAGLWDRWTSPAGEMIDSCTIITTEANEAVRGLHDRMPVILVRGDFQQWLESRALEDRLFRPFPAEKVQVYPVSRRVNGTEYDGPECVARDEARDAGVQSDGLFDLR